MQFIQGHSVLSSLPESHYWLLSSLVIGSFFLGAMSTAYFKRRSQDCISVCSDTIINERSNGSFEQSSENAFLSQQIKTVIKNLSNSQYVLKDDQCFTSLYQTPLRQSIHHLRLISESLMDKSDSSEKALLETGLRSQSNSQSSCYPLLVLQRQVETISKLCEQCKISFVSQVDISPNVAVKVNSEWLSAAIYEVLVNAIKQNKQEISLSISAQTASGMLIINIIDDGVGISSAISQQFSETSTGSVHLFRRKCDSENLMNLSLIQDKLLKLGGKVVIRSARKYRTQVSLQLPISMDVGFDGAMHAPDKTKNTIKSKLRTGNSSAPKLLWVASIGPVNTQASSKLLNHLKRDFAIREESNIEGALSCISDYRPDCIIIDEDLKANNSFLVKAWVQASDNFGDIPVVTMGAALDNSTQLRMMQTGITAAIEKPIVLTELRSLINNVIAEKNKLLNKVEEAIANYHINAMDHIGYEDKEGERFFTLFNEVLEENFQDYDFRLVEAAKLMHMGDKTLSRKIGKYYQLKFGDLVKKYRLNKARELIIQGQRVTTVAYETGFNSASYFTQCFRAEFGFAPSMLAKER